jgi:hypothetical protein
VEGVLHLLDNVAEWTGTPGVCTPAPCGPEHDVSHPATRALFILNESFLEGTTDPKNLGKARYTKNERRQDLGFRCVDRRE